MFLVASGLSIIFGVTRIVNFAHGSFYMLGAYIGYTLVQAIGSTGDRLLAAVAISAVAVGLIGVAMEILLLRRIYKAPELFQLIATFGVILVIQDVTLWVWGSEDLVGPQAPGLKGAADILGKPIPEYDLALIAISPLVLIGLWAAVQSDTLGHAGQGRDPGPTDGGGAGRQPALAVYRCPVSRLRARRVGRCGSDPQGRRRPADGLQHPRRRIRRGRGGRHGEYFRSVLGRGAVRPFSRPSASSCCRTRRWS